MAAHKKDRNLATEN